MSDVATSNSAPNRSPDGHSHVHASFKGDRTTAKTRWLLAALLFPLITFAAVGAAVLWPSDNQQTTAPFGPPTAVVKGQVSNVTEAQCQANTPDAGICMTLTVNATDGPEAGTDITLVLPKGPGQVDLKTGDPIVMGRSNDGGVVTYYFSDLQRGNGLAILSIAFAVFVVLIARWRGLGALAGLVITYAIITLFVLPAILDGQPPVYVTLVGAAAIVLVVLYVAHGFNARTTTAIIGTLLSLFVVGAFSSFAVNLANITGLSSEEVTYVQNYATEVNVHGLLLGGIILGALGVLNDMTVSQSSSVWEIHRARPDQSRRQIYSGAMRVGRDHIASTIYTLVLAYTGASLPLLILFTLSDRSLSTVLTTDLVGEEIVRAIVGSIGLMLSVPITTLLAAIVVKGARHKDMHAPAVATIPTVSDAELSIEHDELSARAASVGEAAARAAVARSAEAAVPPNASAGTEDGTSVGSSTAETAAAYKGPERRKRKGFFRRRRSTVFGERRMTRRERKFWEED